MQDSKSGAKGAGFCSLSSVRRGACLPGCRKAYYRPGWLSRRVTSSIALISLDKNTLARSYQISNSLHDVRTERLCTVLSINPNNFADNNITTNNVSGLLHEVAQASPSSFHFGNIHSNYIKVAAKFSIQVVILVVN